MGAVECSSGVSPGAGSEKGPGVSTTRQQHAVTVGRETLLDLAGEQGWVVYRLVRAIVDDLEEVAPWHLLYYPPDTEHGFFAMEDALFDVVDGIPARVGAAIVAISQPGVYGTFEPEQIETWFESILRMVHGDRERLTEALNGIVGGGVGGVARDFACELSADLKGKYQSALMGVAAKVVGHGRWSGPQVEPVLFEEKREEVQRNRLLVMALEGVVGQIRSLPQEVPLAELITTWLECRRVDQYALVDLFSLQGAVGQLLKEKSRRALYSGDYHRIRERERLLADRITEIYALHSQTWSKIENQGSEVVYPRLVELALAIAAIVDTRILKAVIGEASHERLRSMAVADLAAAPRKGRRSAVDRADVEVVPEHLSHLVMLLEDDDLLTFLELLLGNVLKRSSLTPELTVSEPAGGEEDGVAIPTVTLSGLREVLTVLASVRAADSPRWQAFAAAHPDLGPAGALDPAVVAECQQLGWELADRLVPRLGHALPWADLEVELADWCTRLISQSTASEAGVAELQVAVHEISRLLDRLTARVHGLIERLSS